MSPSGPRIQNSWIFLPKKRWKLLQKRLPELREYRPEGGKSTLAHLCGYYTKSQNRKNKTSKNQRENQNIQKSKTSKKKPDCQRTGSALNWFCVCLYDFLWCISLCDSCTIVDIRNVIVLECIANSDILDIRNVLFFFWGMFRFGILAAKSVWGVTDVGSWQPKVCEGSQIWDPGSSKCAKTVWGVPNFMVFEKP